MFHVAYKPSKQGQREYQLDSLLVGKESHVDGWYCPTCGHSWKYLSEPLIPG